VDAIEKSKAQTLLRNQQCFDFKEQKAGFMQDFLLRQCLMLDIEVVRLDWFRSEAYQDISPLQGIFNRNCSW